MASFGDTLKALMQLGPEPMALYALYRLGLRSGHYRRLEQSARAGWAPPEGIRPLFTLPRRDDLLKIMGQAGYERLLKEADEIARGEVRLFGGEPQPLELTFAGPLQHWSEYELGRAPIPFDALLIRDIKYLWEPARFAWALTLGRAWVASGEERYAEAFWRCFEAFVQGNPPYLGPHWMNGQEVAIRLMSLLWAAQMFEHSAASTPARRATLLASIAAHAARIPETLVYARSQDNNHLVTEAAALYAAGSALQNDAWRVTGWKWLNRALQGQISSYGEYIQHSSNYHRLMLQAVLWVHGLMPVTGQRWPRATEEALMRASHWLFSMIDPVSGRAPNLGANDGSLLLPLSASAVNDFRPTVQAAARAFLRTGLPAGEWDELSAWLGLTASNRTADSDAYMAEHLRGRDSWGYLRASRFPSRLSHMDQLHFDLWRAGRNVAQDAGTYLYNGEPPWDNPLVTTRVHNTVTVDFNDQMHRAGRFLVLDWAPAYSKRLLDADESIMGRMLAYHQGYRRLGIRHERVVTVHTDQHWEVHDNLVFTRPGEHHFRLHWLLTDGEWRVEQREGRIVVHITPEQGEPFILRIQADPRIAYSEVATSVVRAGEVVHGSRKVLPFEGWISPTYGVKLPALSVAVDVSSSKSVSFVSEFLWE